LYFFHGTYRSSESSVPPDTTICPIIAVAVHFMHIQSTARITIGLFASVVMWLRLLDGRERNSLSLSFKLISLISDMLRPIMLHSQTLVTSYVIDAFLCLAMLHAWTLQEYQQLRCSASDGGYLRRQKASGQLEKTAGSPSQRPAQQSSGGSQRTSAWRSEIARGHGAAQRSTRTTRRRPSVAQKIT